MHKSKFGECELTKLATINQAQKRYQMSRNSLMKYAENCGAVKKFSAKLIRIDIQKMDAAIEKY